MLVPFSKRLAVVLLACAVTAVLVPHTQAHTGPGDPHEIRTGDVHVYADGQHWEPTECSGTECLGSLFNGCLDVVTNWRITLNVTAAAPTDVLAFAIEHPGMFAGANVVVGTGQSSWSMTTQEGCRPTTTVHGVLVEDVAHYELWFQVIY